MGKHEAFTGAQRVVKRHEALRAQGLRSKQIWVPDLRDLKMSEAIRLSAAEINRRDRTDGVMDYLESLSDKMMASLPPYGHDTAPER